MKNPYLKGQPRLTWPQGNNIKSSKRGKVVQILESMVDQEEFRYKKWVTLQDVVETLEEFLELFSSAVVKLLSHHYTSKKQGEAFKDAKESLDQT